MYRQQQKHGKPTSEQLAQARVLTHKQKDRGLLRKPRLWKVVEYRIGNDLLRAVKRIKPRPRPRRVECPDCYRLMLETEILTHDCINRGNRLGAVPIPVPASPKPVARPKPEPVPLKDCPV